MAECGLQLVGAFDVLAGMPLEPPTLTRFLCHWRYYYDPPELQVSLGGVGVTLQRVAGGLILILNILLTTPKILLNVNGNTLAQFYME